MPGRKRKFDAEVLVGRDVAVPLDYFGERKKRRVPVRGQVQKVVDIDNEYYRGVGVEVKLKRAVLDRQVWWLPCQHAKDFVQNNATCSVCGEGGDLLLCDGCPEAFHLGCIGLDAEPEADEWFCDARKCGGPKLERASAHENNATCSPEADEWFCDARKCGGPKLERAAVHIIDEFRRMYESARGADGELHWSKSAVESAVAAAGSPAPAPGEADPATAADALDTQLLGAAVRRVQREHGMRDVRFWARVAAAVGVEGVSAEACAALWFEDCGADDARRRPAAGKGKGPQCPTAEDNAATAGLHAGAEAKTGADESAESMPPPLPRKTPQLKKLPGRETVKHRVLVRGIIEKQEHGHLDTVVLETPEQLFLSPSIDADSPIAFGGFGCGAPGASWGCHTSAAAAAVVAPSALAAPPVRQRQALGDVDTNAGRATPAPGGTPVLSMSQADHDRYMVQRLKQRNKSCAERQLERIKAARADARAKQLGGSVARSSACACACAGRGKRAGKPGGVSAQMRVGRHIVKAKMGGSGCVQWQVPDSESEGEEEEEEAGGSEGDDGDTGRFDAMVDSAYRGAAAAGALPH
eukprot:g3509.t1